MWKLLVRLLCASVLLNGAGLLSVAQSPVLPFNEPVSATIDTPDESLRWQFFALQNDMISFHVDGVGDFDPVLSLVDESGATVISNDDYDYPESRDALLEGITMPRTGIYEAVVSGYAGTTGSFALTMLPGYGDLAAGPDLELVEWEKAGRINETITTAGVTLEVEGIRERGVLISSEGGPYDDFYAQINVPRIEGQGGWVIGLVLRWRPTDTYYSAEVSSDGLWRLVAVERGEERVIRDWSSHPGLQLIPDSFRLGVLANGNSFEVFFNGQIVGQAFDDTIPDGRAGIVVLGADAVGSRTTALVDELTVTVPVEVEGARVFPEQLVMGGDSQIVHELERRGVIPPGGQQVLSVPESFIERRGDGVDTLSLGRGTQFRSFVLSSVASLETQDEGLAGCGLMLRRTEDDRYTVAYKDNQGGYGISERRGDRFAPGVFGERDDWAGLSEVHLLAVAVDETVHFFVNGHHAGHIDVLGGSGVVGNAIVNFDEVHSICRFTDTWLWGWE